MGGGGGRGERGGGGGGEEEEMGLRGGGGRGLRCTMFQFLVLSFALLVFLYSPWGCLGVNFEGDVGELLYVLFASSSFLLCWRRYVRILLPHRLLQGFFFFSCPPCSVIFIFL